MAIIESNFLLVGGEFGGEFMRLFGEGVVSHHGAILVSKEPWVGYEWQLFFFGGRGKG